MIVVCPYCKANAELVDSAEIYNGKSYGMAWLCRPCGAYVGCHKNSRIHMPLGRLANAELREAKIAAHAAFDAAWKETLDVSRTKAYAWLARTLHIHPSKCHIGMMDVDMCNKVIEVCKDGMENTGR